ncbi:centlein isoform X2 [Astyanax mexicanus]|uniref:centlein isoform X2 n=1 Tax=Astyanax mexicanus TaxID=7994 RepID=UPI0020CB4786|nr:centlein isoform X2 [Astyanax mexicanus]
MESKERERVMLLEEEVKSLSEELIQCQADKEFVWSLWKRLQVANPDLTQAVSLVVEREKQKAEAKDRKVLEILQAKDLKIQELEKDVAAQRQELGGAGQRRWQVEEECRLMKKELAGLSHRLADKSRQLQEVEECKRVSEERGRSLQERCSVLQHELLTNQQNQNQQQENHTARIQELQEELVRLRAGHQEELVRLRAEHQEELVKLRAELLEVQGRSAALSSQLSTVEQQSSEREQQLQKLRRELVEIQALYRQSVEHAGEQAELIQQLEGLNLDTQHVLRSQEQAHCTHTASYQKLYTELSASYQALLRREDELRQRDMGLTAQLHQRDQQISQLQAELQQLQQQLRDKTSQAVLQQQYPEPQSSTPIPQSQYEEAAVGPELPAHPPTCRTQSSSPEQSCRSISAEAEGRIQQLEELLSLKTQENEELKRAHAKRHDRLRLIQTNYRAVKEQLREVEEVQDQPKGRRKRAEPWQLRQENSDAVWNELAFFKRENRKLLNEKAHLEEELDVARVHAAMDRATAQELRLQEQQELQLRDDGNSAAGGALILPSAQRPDKSIKKIEVLERRMVSLEREAEQLRDDNHALQEAGLMLSRERSDLQAALKRAAAREEAELDRLRVQLLGEVQGLEARLQGCRREAAEARRDRTQARHALLRLRQELGVLRAERDFHRAAAHRWSKAKTRPPTTRARGPTRAHTHSHTHTHPERRPRASSRTHTLSEQRQQRTHSPAKDEWEDMSPDSETEEFSDSLESQPPAQLRNPPAAKGCRYELITPGPRDPVTTHQPYTAPGTVRSDVRRKRRRMKNTALHHRLLCLQQQVAVLQSASRAATERLTQTQTELQTLTHRLQASKHTSQKQACELAVLQQQKAVLEAELEQWRKSRSLSQELPTFTPDPAHSTCTTPSSAPDSAHSTIKQLEADIKQLNSKLKSATSEGNKQRSVIKGLRAELHDRDQRLKELQDKLSHAERDVVMKRQLVEDLRSRMKILQDSESSRRALINDLEKKVKTLVEEASNRKAFIESLKRRLSVANQEKSQSESSGQKLQEDLQKRDQKLAALQVRLVECEGSRAELEEKVCVQVRAASQQHSDALHTLQNQLSLAQRQQEQLRSFTQALVVELSREVQESRAELRKRRRERKKRERADRGVSRSSMQKAQSIAASILNLTHTDLASILHTDQEEEEGDEGGGDWMDHIRHVLQQQVPSAAVLVELVLEKLKELRMLTEELAVFSSTNSQNV